LSWEKKPQKQAKIELKCSKKPSPAYTFLLLFVPTLLPSFFSYTFLLLFLAPFTDQNLAPCSHFLAARIYTSLLLFLAARLTKKKELKCVF
jgi:hypothetical protein